jgi:Meiotically up-regulated gene 113
MGHVYLIGNSKFHWYKIGKSADARIRVLDLGVLLPFRIEVVEVVRCDAYSFLERRLHQEFAEHRVNGEWFHFDGETLNAVCTMMELLGTPVVGIAGFHNMERDFAPPGKVLKIRIDPDFSDEEREKRKMAAMSRRDGRPHCRLCRRRINLQQIS